MNPAALSAGFWQDATPHVAVNPADPGAAEGLAEFALARGLTSTCWFQTSGSEGLPKWVALNKNAFLISARAVNGHFEAGAGDHWLVPLPLHHVGGFAILARAHLAGCRVTLAPGKWQPQAFAECCAGAGITLTSLVPAQVYDLVRQRLPGPDSLRAVMVGGGGMTRELAEAALALGWRVFQSYGMTEAASQIATQPYNSFGPVFDLQSLEVLPHWQVAADSDGTLRLSGPALALGYARRQAEGTWSWEAIEASAGWRTRDQVRLWRHGTRQFLQFVGRGSGWVKILGELVHLQPLQQFVEKAALELGWTVPPVLLARPDARAETRLVLVMEVGTAAAEALMARFNAAHPAWLRIAEVRRIERLPRSELGKVRFSELENWLDSEKF